MKKISILLVIFSFLFLSSTCYAIGKTVEVPELDLSMNIPDSYTAVTRNTGSDSEANAILQEYGYSVESLQDLMKPNHIYLDALNYTDSSEIILVSVENDESPELKNFSQSDIDDLISLMTSGSLEDYYTPDPEAVILEDIKLTYEGQELINDTLYLVFSSASTQEGNTVYTKNYFTITRNNGITIKLLSYNVPLSPEQNELLSSVVNSISFSSPESDILPYQSNKSSESNFSEIGYKILTWVIASAIIILISLTVSLIKKRASKKDTDIPAGQSASPTNKKAPHENGNADISDSDKNDSDPNISLDKEQIYCNHCGKKLPSGSAFCLYCGKKVK